MNFVAIWDLVLLILIDCLSVMEYLVFWTKKPIWYNTNYHIEKYYK